MATDVNRDIKVCKLDPIKSEPSMLTTPMMKQPIETNPDIVKSLLQECYTSNNKFDAFSMDTGSPLDVINPIDSTPLAATSYPSTVDMSDALQPKQEPRDNGYSDEHHKRNKSKKKKEKHRHKEKLKKKKSHKSDREDRDERKETSLKIILSKDKSDSKSSPESLLKIKIPIKDVNRSDLTNAAPPLHPAPLKLKISKEKIGVFNHAEHLPDGASTSSSTHKKKEKDRSKSKTSKHGSNNNNNSDFKDIGYQQHPLSVNKVSET